MKMECRICKSSKASKHSYYGASEICPSCRGFFMRAVQTQFYTLFDHNAKVKCAIDSKNRKSCKKCRFEKCLQVGMKIKYVKTAQNRCHQILNSMEKPKYFTDYFVEKSNIEDLEKLKMAATYSDVYQYYASRPDLFITHMCSQTFTPKDTEEFHETDRIWSFSSTKYLTHQDGVANDAEALFQHNYQRLLQFEYAITFKIGWYNLQEFIDYGLIHRHESSEIDTLMTLLECLGTGLKGQCKIEYETMYSSPWASHLDIEEEHKEINQKIANWYYKVKDPDVIHDSLNPDYDRCLFLLMELIFLYNTDGIECQLQNYEKIKKLQLQYANLLHKYLKSKSTGEDNDANTLFSNGLMLIHDTKRVYDLSLHKLKLD